MHYAENMKQKVEFSRQRKAIIQATLRKANKRIEALKTRVDMLQEAQAQPKSNFNNNKKEKKEKKPKSRPAITIEIDANSSPVGDESLRGNNFVKATPNQTAIICASMTHVISKIVSLQDPSMILCNAGAKLVTPKIIWIQVPFTKIRSRSQSLAQRASQHKPRQRLLQAKSQHKPCQCLQQVKPLTRLLVHHLL